MSDKQLNDKELEKVSGGQGINNIINIRINLIFKFDEEGRELNKEITLTFNKRYTTLVSDSEIKTRCNEYCNDNHCLYVSHTVIGKTVL